MAKKILDFTVDTIQSTYSLIGTVKQLDSVFFNIQITENGVAKNISNQTLKLFAKKNDSKIVEQRTDINIINASEGRVSIDLLNSALQCSGFTVFELEISDSTGCISTANFILKVKEKIANDKVIESTTEISALKEIEDYVAQAKIEIQEFKALKDDMVETNNNINVQENLRVQAENLRIEAELNREKSLKNLDELKTNYFGKEFNTPQERFLSEFEYIHMSGEKGSFLPFSTNKSHKVQESIEGKTRNMILEGETLQNLVNDKFFIQNDTIYDDASKTYTFSKDWGRGFKTTLLKSNTIYTIAMDVKASNGGGLRLEYDVEVDGSIICSYIVNQNDPISNYKHIITKFTTKTGFNFINLTARNVYNGIINVKNIVILEGDWTNKEIPEYFEEIKSIGQDSDKISISSTGKNINLSDIELGEIGINGQHFKSNNIFRSKDFIKCYGNISYISSIDNSIYIVRNINTYDKNKTFITAVNNGTAVPFNTEFIKITGRKKDSSEISIDELNDINIQIEEGIIATPYEHYKQDKKDILIPFDDGLKGINNIRDEINGITNKIIKKIEKYTFTGDEGFTLWADREESSSIAFKIEFSKMNWNIGKRNSNVISNNFNSVNNNADIYYCRQNGVNIGYPNEGTGDIISFAIPRTNINPCNVNGFKAWLKENPTTIYYELAEPVEYDLTNQDINLNTYKDLTYITTEAPSTFSAPVTISSTIARLNRENKTLEKENIKLKEETKNLTIENEYQQIDIDNNQLATVEIFEMIIGAVGVNNNQKVNNYKIGGVTMVEVYVSLIIKGKKKIEDVPAIIRTQVETMLRELGVVE